VEIIWILLAVLVLSLPIVSFVDRYRDRSHRRILGLREVATKWGGEATEGAFAEGCKLTLRVEDVPGEVTFGYAGLSGLTRVQFKAPSERRLRITTEYVTNWRQRMEGRQDIETGEARFDNVYRVEASDAAWAREVLDEPLRLSLYGLFQVYGPTVSLDASSSGVTLRVGRILVDDPGLLGHLVGQATKALRRIHPDRGVVASAVEVREGRCPVCDHPMEKPLRCPACLTPHHEQCWTYMGGCAIFGCGSRARRAG
jgi:hypothetical protein